MKFTGTATKRIKAVIAFVTVFCCILCLCGCSPASLPSSDAWSEGDGYTIDNTIMVEKKTAEMDVITLTDLQIGSKTGAFRTLRRTLKGAALTKRDLVIVTGDLFDPGYTKKDVRRFLRLMRRFKCNYIVVLGESDMQGKCSLDWTLNKLESEKRCLFARGPENLGYGNFVVNLYEDLGGRKHVLHSFICMDSSNGDGDVAAFSEAQVNWFKFAVDGVRSTWKGENVPITLVTHKPLSEFVTALSQTEFGTMGYNEPINNDGDTSALFSYIRENTINSLVLFGHKHYDYSIQIVDSVIMVMSPKCGYLGDYVSDFQVANNDLDSDLCCGWGHFKIGADGYVSTVVNDTFYPRLFRANGAINKIG